MHALNKVNIFPVELMWVLKFPILCAIVIMADTIPSFFPLGKIVVTS